MNAFVIVTNQRDYKNDIIIIAIHLEKEFNQRKVNEIKSIYGRVNELEYFKRQFWCNNILYVDKNRAIDLLRSRGLQLPKASTNLNSENILSHKNKNVNQKKVMDKNGANDLLHFAEQQLPRASENPSSGHKLPRNIKNVNQKKYRVYKNYQDYER